MWEYTRMKKEIVKKKIEERWIDVHSDSECAKYGIYRARVMEPRDESVWSKTPHERHILHTLGKLKGDNHFHTVPKKIIPVRDKLIIYIKPNKKFNKTTYSRKCWQHEIPELLSKYVRYVKDKGNQSLVLKYSFNGITYDSKEVPFWN